MTEINLLGSSARCYTDGTDYGMIASPSYQSFSQMGCCLRWGRVSGSLAFADLLVFGDNVNTVGHLL